MTTTHCGFGRQPDKHEAAHDALRLLLSSHEDLLATLRAIVGIAELMVKAIAKSDHYGGGMP